MDKRINVSALTKEAKKMIDKWWGIDSMPNIVMDRLSNEEWKNFKIVENGQDLYMDLVGLYHPKDRTIEFNSEVNLNRS